MTVLPPGDSGPVFGPRPTPDEIHFVRTADNWRLALHRYLPRGEGAHREPVMLHHGLGSSAALFDLGIDGKTGPSASLAHWLADRGYDVWCAELRGSGYSERPRKEERERWAWTLDDFYERDDPAFIAHILDRSDHDRLHWIGHSLGGALLMVHCAIHGSPQVASGISIAGALDFEGLPSAYRIVEPLKDLGRALKHIPTGRFARFIAPLMGRWEARLNTVGCSADNTDPAVARAIYAGTTYDMPGELLYQLASSFEPGGLRSLDHDTTFSKLAPKTTTPLLLIAGSHDQICAPKAVDRALVQLAGARHEALHFGRQQGHSADYGHYDLLVGLLVEQEVYPRLLDWLTQHSVRDRVGTPHGN